MLSSYRVLRDAKLTTASTIFTILIQVCSMTVNKKIDTLNNYCKSHEETAYKYEQK